MPEIFSLTSLQTTIYTIGMNYFLHFNIDSSLLARVDSFRHERRISSRAQAIRMLLELGLSHNAKPSASMRADSSTKHGLHIPAIAHPSINPLPAGALEGVK